MVEVQKDLFEATLVQEKIDYVKKSKNIAWLETANLILVTTEAQLRELVAEALATDTPKAVDTETTGITKDDKLVGVSVSWKKHDTGKYIAFYVPLYSEIEIVEIPPYTTLSILKPLIEQPCVWYNFKFDYKVFKSVGIEAGLLADVSLMELFPKDGLDNVGFNKRVKSSSGLKAVFKEVFDLDMLSLSDVLGKGAYNFALAPLDLAKSYATVDAYATISLYDHFLPLMTTDRFIYDLENKVMPIVANMEYDGVMVDLNLAKQEKDAILAENADLEKKVFELAGEEFNIGSPIMLTHILFEKLKLPVLKFIENERGEITDKPSTDKEALTLLKEKHDIIAPLLTYKENLKLVNTFLDKLPKVVASDGKIHCSYRPYGAISGRFTSNSPNLQQIPKSSDDESNKASVRKCFIASPGYYLVEADYSQMEYSLYASLSADPELLKAFEKEGADFHKATASTMFGIPLEKVTKAERHKAKTLNFGILFGMGTKSLAANLKCSEPEAEKLHETYFSKMPTAKLWASSLHAQIAADGYSSTYYGRKRVLPNAKSTDRGRKFGALREGLNHRIQGTGADCTKIAMVRTSKALKGKDARLIMQVHDSLMLEFHQSIPVKEAVELIKKTMELKIPGFAPLRVDVQVGYNWGQCVSYKDGMTLSDIPVTAEVHAETAPTELLIEGPLVDCSDALKALFKANPGPGRIVLKVADREMVPTDVDLETGEILDVSCLISDSFIDELKALGLTASFR